MEKLMGMIEAISFESMSFNPFLQMLKEQGMMIVVTTVLLTALYYAFCRSFVFVGGYYVPPVRYFFLAMPMLTLLLNLFIFGTVLFAPTLLYGGIGAFATGYYTLFAFPASLSAVLNSVMLISKEEIHLPYALGCVLLNVAFLVLGASSIIAM